MSEPLRPSPLPWRLVHDEHGHGLETASGARIVLCAREDDAKFILKAVNEQNQMSDLLWVAWGIIANAHQGRWAEAAVKWQSAAISWRDRFHDWMTKRAVR